jgi:hypothetical protein
MPQLQAMLGTGSTTPGADWFTGPVYTLMFGIALLLLPLFVILGAASNWREPGRILSETFLYVIKSLLVGEFAIFAVQLLMGLADTLTLVILQRIVGNNLTGLLTHIAGVAAVTTGVSLWTGTGGLVIVFVSGLILLAGVLLLLELLMRQVGIYIALAFVPIGAVAEAYPGTRSWLSRLVQVELVLIFIKPTAMLVLAIGSAMMSANLLGSGALGDPGFVTLLMGLVILGFAAFMVWPLMKMAPWAEGHMMSAVSQQGGGIASIPMRSAGRAGMRRIRQSPRMLAARQRLGLAPAGAAGAGLPAAKAAGAAGLVLEGTRLVVRRAGQPIAVATGTESRPARATMPYGPDTAVAASGPGSPGRPVVPKADPPRNGYASDDPRADGALSRRRGGPRPTGGPWVPPASVAADMRPRRAAAGAARPPTAAPTPSPASPRPPRPVRPVTPTGGPWVPPRRA